MPKIQTVEAEINPNQTMQVRPQSGDGITSGLMSLSRDIVGAGQKIEQYEERQDKLPAREVVNSAQAKALDTISNLKDPPTDEEIQKIKENYDSEINTVAENMKTSGGSDFLQEHSMSNWKVIQNHALSKKVELQGYKDRTTFEKTANDASLLVTKSSFRPEFMGQNLALLKQKEQEVKTQAHELMGTKGDLLAEDKLKDMAMAHFRTALLSSNNGDLAKTLVDTGVYDSLGINGAEKEHLLQVADQYTKSKKAEAVSNVRDQLFFKQVRSQNAENDIYNRAFSSEGANWVQETLDNTDIEDWQRKKSILNGIAAQKTGLIKATSDQTAAILASKIVSGEVTDIGPINDAIVDQSITIAKHKALVGMLQAQQTLKGTPEGVTIQQLDKSARGMYLVDPISKMSKGPLGAQKYAEYQNNVAQAVLNYRKNYPGASLAPLTDPKDPNYIGRFLVPPTRQESSAYMREVQQRAKNGPQGTPIPPKFAPRAAGESLDAYLRRIGEK